MTNDKTIESVIERGLCTGCGTCAGICPLSAIEMVKSDSKGIYIPRLDKERCNQCGLCLEVCPGYFVDFEQLNLELFHKEPKDILLGNYLKCYIGHASDYDIRYNSASGGLVTALLIFALEEEIINGALVTKMSDANPLEPQPFIARTREEIISASKSKYCPVPANMVLKEILKAKEGERFAVVGLPCHIHGLRKAEGGNYKLKEKIALHLGLICSHPMSFLGTEFLLRQRGIANENVIKLDYRGRGWPGGMSIQLKNGNRLFIPHADVGRVCGMAFYPIRCTLCCDGACELADISFGDAWLPEFSDDKIGTSVVISRTRKGEEILQRMMHNRKVELSGITGDKAAQSQGNLRFKKDAIQMRFFLSRLAHHSTPIYKTKLRRAKPTDFLKSALLYLGLYLSSKRRLWGVTPAYIQLIAFLNRMLILLRSH